MFTGLGAVIVAVTGLITALYTAGVIGSKANPNAAAPANVSAAAAAASPNAESERYKSLAGRWEVVEATSDNSARTTWHYEASVSGNVLTLTGKIFKIGEDKNLTDDEERMAGTFVMTLLGSGGMGEYRFKGADGTSLVTDATIRFADDLRQFEGRVDAAGKTYTYTGRKL